MSLSSAPRTVHLVNSHLTYPGWSEGGLTTAMVERARTHLEAAGHRVTVTKVEDGYDPDVEVQRHVDADLVILQAPINWFGAPWIYKRYVDEVFNAGLHSGTFLSGDGRTREDPTRQYGSGGLMQGRGFFVATSWNAPTEVFDNPEGVLMQGKSVDDLLLNLTASYTFVGFTVLKSYGLHDVFKDGDTAKGLADYGRHLDEQLAALPRRGAVVGG